MTLLTISDGSSEKLTLRPTVPTWLSTNQSPEPTMGPLIMVWVRLGLVPRRLTRSFSSKPPSPAPAELMVTPGRRCSESATFLSGILPMSSAVITSTTETEFFLWLIDCSSAARMPVTTTWVLGAAGAAVWAKAGDRAPDRVRAAAKAIGVRWACMGISCGWVVRAWKR